MTMRLDLRRRKQSSTHDRSSAQCSPTNSNERHQPFSHQPGRVRGRTLKGRTDSIADRYATSIPVFPRAEMRDDAGLENCLVVTSGSESTDASSERSRKSRRKRPLPPSCRSQVIEEDEEDCIYDQPPLADSSTIQTPDESMSKGEDSYTLNSYSSDFFTEEHSLDRYDIVERQPYYQNFDRGSRNFLCGNHVLPTSDECCRTCTRKQPSLSARARLESPSYHRAIIPASRAMVPYKFSRGHSPIESRFSQEEAEWDTDIVPVGGPEAARAEDLIHGKGRNIFIGMLVEYAPESIKPIVAEYDSPQPSLVDHSDYQPSLVDHSDHQPPLVDHSDHQHLIASTAAAAVWETLRVNITAGTRTNRLHRALGSRKPKGIDEDDAATLENPPTNSTFQRENTSNPQSGANAEAAPFNMDRKLRKSRLSRALRPRSKRDGAEWRGLEEEKNRIVFRALVIVMMQKLDLTCDELFSVSFVQFLFRWAAAQERLPYVDSLVLYQGPTEEDYERLYFFLAVQLSHSIIVQNERISSAKKFFETLKGGSPKKEQNAERFLDAVNFFETLKGDNRKMESQQNSHLEFFETLIGGEPKITNEEMLTPTGTISMARDIEPNQENAEMANVVEFFEHLRGSQSTEEKEEVAKAIEFFEELRGSQSNEANGAVLNAVDFFEKLRCTPSNEEKEEVTNTVEFFEQLRGSRRNEQSEDVVNAVEYFEGLCDIQGIQEKQDVNTVEFFERLRGESLENDNSSTALPTPNRQTLVRDESQTVDDAFVFVCDSPSGSIASSFDENGLGLDLDVKRMFETAVRETDISNLSYINSPETECDESDDGLAEELEQMSQVKDLELLNADQDGYFLDPSIHSYLWTMIIETDLCALDYLNAHYISSLPDDDADDDGLTMELRNLTSIEISLCQELSRIKILHSPAKSRVPVRGPVPHASSRLGNVQLALSAGHKKQPRTSKIMVADRQIVKPSRLEREMAAESIMETPNPSEGETFCASKVLVGDKQPVESARLKEANVESRGERHFVEAGPLEKSAISLDEHAIEDESLDSEDHEVKNCGENNIVVPDKPLQETPTANQEDEENNKKFVLVDPSAGPQYPATSEDDKPEWTPHASAASQDGDEVREKGKVLPDNIEDLSEKEALKAVFDALIALSSDEYDKAGSEFTESTVSTFDAEEARRAVQAALMQFPPPAGYQSPSPHAPATTPDVQFVEAFGNWNMQESPRSHQLNDLNRHEDDLFVCLHTQPTTSTLSLCGGSMDERETPRHVHVDDNFPSLLNATVSTSSLPSPVGSNAIILRLHDESTPELLQIEPNVPIEDAEFPEAKATGLACWFCIHSITPEPCRILTHYNRTSAEEGVETVFQGHADACCGRVKTQKPRLLLENKAFSPGPGYPALQFESEQAPGETTTPKEKDAPEAKPPIAELSEYFAVEKELAEHESIIRRTRSPEDQSDDKSLEPPMSVLEVTQLSSDESGFIVIPPKKLLDMDIGSWFRIQNEGSMESDRFFPGSSSDPRYMSLVSLQDQAQASEEYESSEGPQESGASSSQERTEGSFSPSLNVIRSISFSESGDELRRPVWSMSPNINSFSTVSEYTSVDEWSLAPKLTPLLEDDESFVEEFDVCGSTLVYSMSAQSDGGDLDVPVLQMSYSDASRKAEQFSSRSQRSFDATKKKYEELYLFCDFEGFSLQSSLLRHSGEMLVYNENQGVLSLSGVRSNNTRIRRGQRERQQAVREKPCPEKLLHTTSSKINNNFSVYSDSENERPLRRLTSTLLIDEKKSHVSEDPGSNSSGSTDTISGESDIKTSDDGERSSLDGESICKSEGTSCSEQMHSEESENENVSYWARKSGILDSSSTRSLIRKVLHEKQSGNESESTIETFGSSEPGSFLSSHNSIASPFFTTAEEDVDINPNMNGETPRKDLASRFVCGLSSSMKEIEKEDLQDSSEDKDEDTAPEGTRTGAVSPTASRISGYDEDMAASDISLRYQISMDGESIEMKFNDLVMNSSSTGTQRTDGYRSLECGSEDERGASINDEDAPINSIKRKVPLSHFKNQSKLRRGPYCRYDGPDSHADDEIPSKEASHAVSDEIKMAALEILGQTHGDPKPSPTKRSRETSKQVSPKAQAGKHRLADIDFDAVYSESDAFHNRKPNLAGRNQLKADLPDEMFDWLSDISESTDIGGSSSSSSSSATSFWTKRSNYGSSPTAWSLDSTVYSPKPQVISVNPRKRHTVTFNTQDADWEVEQMKNKKLQAREPEPKPSFSCFGQLAEINDSFWLMLCSEK